MLPIYTVRYERIVGAYLGETATKLAQLFEYIRTQPCVLFLMSLKHWEKSVEINMKREK